MPSPKIDHPNHIRMFVAGMCREDLDHASQPRNEKYRRPLSLSLLWCARRFGQDVQAWDRIAY